MKTTSLRTKIRKTRKMTKKKRKPRLKRSHQLGRRKVEQHKLLMASQWRGHQNANSSRRGQEFDLIGMLLSGFYRASTHWNRGVLKRAFFFAPLTFMSENLGSASFFFLYLFFLLLSFGCDVVFLLC